MNALQLAIVTMTATPQPSGPEAPADVAAMVTRGLNFGWFLALVACFGMAIWGFGSLAYASKKQHFGGINEGKKTVLLAVGGAAGLSLIRGLFAFFGV